MQNGLVGVGVAAFYLALLLVVFHDREQLASGLALLSFVIAIGVTTALDEVDSRRERQAAARESQEARKLEGATRPAAAESSKPLGPVRRPPTSAGARARRASG